MNFTIPVIWNCCKSDYNEELNIACVLYDIDYRIYFSYNWPQLRIQIKNNCEIILNNESKKNLRFSFILRIIEIFVKITFPKCNLYSIP